LKIKQQFQLRLCKRVTPNGATNQLLDELAEGNKRETRIGHSHRVAEPPEIS